MNNIINKNTREIQMAKQGQLATLSDDELNAMITQKQSGGGRLGAGLSTTADIFGQMGGIKTPKTSSDINDILMKEYAKQYAKKTFGETDPIKEVKLEMEKTKLEGLKQKQEEKLLKQEEKNAVAETAKENIVSNANDMLSTINEVKSGLQYFGPLGNLPTQATPGGILSTIGQPLGVNKGGFAARRKWETNIDRLLALKGFDMMKELKNASKTGATGLGQLSEKEGEWLRQASTALKKDIGQEQAIEILSGMERLYKKVLTGKQGTIPTQVGQNNDPLGIR